MGLLIILVLMAGGAQAAFNLGTLTTLNSTSVITIKPNHLHTVAMTVSAISTNVVMRVEGSLDNTNWYNMDDTNTDETLTTTGAYMFHKSPFYGRFLRVTMVSKSPVGSTPRVSILYDGISSGGKE